MSQLIDDLVGEQCTIKSESILDFAEKQNYPAWFWMQISYTDKKDKQATKLLRIEMIEEIEIEE